MIDIHCHILPDIDDGPKTFEESVAMAKMAAEDGIAAIVATPHLNEKLYDPAEISRRVHWLNHLLRTEKVPVSILQGADVSVVFRPKQVQGFSINDTEYILIEFPHTHLPWNAREIISNFIDYGYKPIITHPERNPTIKTNPKALLEVLMDSCYVQVTAGSLVGEFGKTAKDCAVYLLKAGVVDVLATDAHSTTFRKPCLSAGLAVAEQIVGTDCAQQMVFGTPAKVIAGLNLPSK